MPTSIDGFVADFLAAGPTGGEVLDLGTGTAQIPIELCRQDPGFRVLAVDLSGHMLLMAGDNIRRAGLAERIKTERIDAKRLPYADGAFAAVMSNSIVHHIAEPGQLLAEALRVTAAGGLVFIRDLMRPVDQPTLSRLVDTYAAGANAHQRQMFDDSLHAALDLDEVRALVVKLALPPTTVAPTSDRHWTWAVRKA